MRKFFFSLIIIIALIFLYARYIETSGLKIKEYSYESTILPSGFDGFKIVHFSDTLYSSTTLDHIKYVVEQINKQKPNIVVFTGDLLNGKISDKKQKELTDVLKAIDPEMYKYAVLGDQDNKQSEEILIDSDFIILDNTAEYIFNESTEPIVIVGGDNITEETYTLEDNLEYNFAITLTHKPDDFANLVTPAYENLILSGHSLGGQIRIPFWGALITKDGAKTYTDDHYTDGNKTMYVSYGIGTDKYPFRLFNKSSINVYRLNTK